MNNILGLDVSMTSTGWYIQDGKKKPNYGSFKTGTKDGLDIQRYMTQRDRFINLINENKISHIGIEQPFLRSFGTEKLYALHQLILEACYTRHLKIVYITPAQVKSYAVGNYKADKNEIVFKTREVLKFTTEKINNDECDAYWVSVLAKKFWELHTGESKENDLSEEEKFIFLKTKSKKPGILYRKNELFYLF